MRDSSHYTMISQAKLTGTVQTVSAFFAVNFTTKFSKLFILYLQCFFAFVTVFCMFSTFEGVKIPVYIFVLIIQIIIPLFIEICINIEAFKKKNKEENILKKFENLDKTLEISFSVRELSGIDFVHLKFLLKFLVLIVVRVIKLMFAGTVFSVNMMFPELVASVSDYAFTLYVDLLTIRIKTYSKNVDVNNAKTLQTRQDFLAFYKMANLLTERFRVSLFSNITLNFVVLIINMYWIFIRIVYGPFR